MFRSVVTLLVALPMLLPQGVCVCDLFSVCEACAEQAVVSDEAAKPVCDCCRCHESEPIEDEGSAIAAKHVCQPSPADKSDKHHPGCPAQGSAQWKAGMQQSVAFVNLDGLTLVNTLDVPAMVCVSSTPPIHLLAADRPIYLTTLSLRI